MGSLRDGCERLWSWQMVNGNFWKVFAAIITVLAMYSQIQNYRAQRENEMFYGRLEERIIAMQEQLRAAAQASSAGLAAVAQRHEDLREKFNDLNVRVHSLPAQMVTQSKALEQTRAQVNTILYEIMGGKKGQRLQQICIDGEC